MKVQPRDHVQFVEETSMIPDTTLLDESAPMEDVKSIWLLPSMNHIAADPSRREKLINARHHYPSTQSDRQAVLANHSVVVEGTYRLKRKKRWHRHARL